MHIPVNGHAAYIATVLAPFPAEAGHHMTGLDSDRFKQRAPSEPPREFSFIANYLRHIEHPNLEAFDAVVRIGELSDDPLGNQNLDLTSDLDYHASDRLTSACKYVGVSRLPFSSSRSTYGASGR